MNISIARLKLTYLLMIDVNIPDHELPDKPITLPDGKLNMELSTKMNNRTYLPKKESQRKTTRSVRYIRFTKRYRD